MPRNVRRITHFISFSGSEVPATAENYAEDAERYFSPMRYCMAKAETAYNDHDRNAWALQAGIHARIAGHCANRALELGWKVF